MVDAGDQGVAAVLAAALTTGANVAPTAKRETLAWRYERFTRSQILNISYECRLHQTCRISRNLKTIILDFWNIFLILDHSF